jgi:hypothetical protein
MGSGCGGGTGAGGMGVPGGEGIGAGGIGRGSPGVACPACGKNHRMQSKTPAALLTNQ